MIKLENNLFIEFKIIGNYLEKYVWEIDQTKPKIEIKNNEYVFNKNLIEKKTISFKELHKMVK